MPSLSLPELVRPYEGLTKRLSADELAVCKKALTDSMLGLRTLYENLEKSEEVDLGLAHTVLAVGEYRSSDLCKTLGIDMDSVQEREQRVAKLRAANGRVHELEQLLGQAGSPEACSLFVKELNRKLSHWWDTQGFGYVRKFALNEWGSLSVQFSCNLYLGSRMFSSTPVSDKKDHEIWLETLSENGYVVVPSKRGHDPALLDCDQNRKKLLALFAQFDNAVVTSMENHYGKDEPSLRSCTVLFRDLGELAELPAPPKDE